MRLLYAEDLARLRALDRRIYDTIVSAIERHPGLPIDEDRSGFAIIYSPVFFDEDSFFVRIDMKSKDPQFLELMGLFNRHSADVWFGVYDLPDWTANRFCWMLGLRDCNNEDEFMSRISEFLDDWFEGQLVLTTRFSDQEPYRWVVKRRGKVIWSKRRLFYRYLGRRTTECQRCQAPPVGEPGV